MTSDRTDSGSAQQQLADRLIELAGVDAAIQIACRNHWDGVLRYCMRDGASERWRETPARDPTPQTSLFAWGGRHNKRAA